MLAVRSPNICLVMGSILIVLYACARMYKVHTHACDTYHVHIHACEHLTRENITNTLWESYMAHKSSFYPPASYFNALIHHIFQQIVSCACPLCAGISAGILGQWRGGGGRDGRMEMDSSPRRRRESSHTRHSLGCGWGSQQQRIMFLAEAKPSGHSKEASLFLSLEFCARAINPPNELRSLGKLYWSLVKKT